MTWVLIFLPAEWLLDLEGRGYKVHNFDLSRLQSRLLLDEPKASFVARPSESNRKEDSDVFFFDSKGGSSGEDETNDQEVEMMDDVFLSAARDMRSAPGDGKKRKGSKEGGERDIARFVRYKLHNHSAKDPLAPSKEAGEMSGESDVENPLSDEEMEDSDWRWSTNPPFLSPSPAWLERIQSTATLHS